MLDSHNAVLHPRQHRSVILKAHANVKKDYSWGIEKAMEHLEGEVQARIA